MFCVCANVTSDKPDYLERSAWKPRRNCSLWTWIPPAQRRLQAAAALKGISMRQYCLSAIDRELARDEANECTGIELPLGYSDAERFAALQKKHFGDKVLPGSSVDLIREARQIRDAQLKDIM